METAKPIALGVPPVGNIEAQVTGSTSMIRWAPGNGVVYQLLATPVPDDIRKVIGGSVLISLMRRDGQTYATYPGNPGMLYHHTFVEEKWGKDLGEEGTIYATALLNWTLFDSETCAQYAMEMFEEAQSRWK